jgi:hypothetical protein
MNYAQPPQQNQGMQAGMHNKTMRRVSSKHRIHRTISSNDMKLVCPFDWSIVFY